jgi:hypothetical protein
MTKQGKPSWYIVAAEDRTVHPELERFVAKRMGATTVELRTSQRRRGVGGSGDTPIRMKRSSAPLRPRSRSYGAE